MLLKKYSYDETNYFYKDKLLNPEQYTYYCAMQDFKPMFLELAHNFMQIKHKTLLALDLLKDEFSEYKSEISTVMYKFDLFMMTMAIILINMNTDKDISEEFINL